MLDQEHDVDQLLTAYEKGTLTRRQLLTTLVLAGAGSSVSAQPTASPLSGRASRVQQRAHRDGEHTSRGHEPQPRR